MHKKCLKEFWYKQIDRCICNFIAFCCDFGLYLHMCWFTVEGKLNAEMNWIRQQNANFSCQFLLFVTCYLQWYSNKIDKVHGWFYFRSDYRFK